MQLQVLQMDNTEKCYSDEGPHFEVQNCLQSLQLTVQKSNVLTARLLKKIMFVCLFIRCVALTCAK